MSRIVSLTQDFYRNYRKPPEKHFSEIEFQCDQVHSMGITVDAYDKMLRQAMSENVYMPSIQKVMDLYEPPKKHRVEVPCMMCNKVGRVYGVKFVFTADNAMMDVVSMDQAIREDGIYQSLCIGRCKCSNGDIYASRLPIAESPKFIIERATERDLDCPYISDDVAKEFNALRLGKEYPPPSCDLWDDIVAKIVSNIGVDENEKSA